MADGHLVDRSWMWHPDFTEDRQDTAGLFVYFKKELVIAGDCPESLPIQITADTRYKLYVNKNLVSFGPTKGDQHLWFYDEIDISRYLCTGQNEIVVIVMRFFYATRYAASFPRLPTGGLRVVELGTSLSHGLGSGSTWYTAIDPSTILRIDEPEDDFLHVYEQVGPSQNAEWQWVPAKFLEYQTSTGNSTPWNLSPRMIPPMRKIKRLFSAVRNVQSDVPQSTWELALLRSSDNCQDVRLNAQSEHCIDLEVPQHTTGFISFRFIRPISGDSSIYVMYAESYEDKPILVPYLRRKSHRCDETKDLFGPRDIYHFEGNVRRRLTCYQDSGEEETFEPFHFRTFRFLRLRIHVGSSELTLRNINIEAVNYPLDVKADLRVLGPSDLPSKLWETSIRTLENCMHDCYEDCPFYEQLQYAMDTRSSSLFTYCLSGDDRMARQAIIQIHNSFQPRIGLTASRAPSHNLQIIPHFSLFWICMLNDHLAYFGDPDFLAPFTPVVDAILGYFHSRINSQLGLVVTKTESGIWSFTDWADQWRPYGIPPAAQESGVSTYTSNLYAYTLKQAAPVVTALGRPSLATEYYHRACQVVDAIKLHCFDGHFFTDSLAVSAVKGRDYSQHNQVWAVLSGAADESAAADLLERSHNSLSSGCFVKTSISMSFYTLRAFSMAGDDAYERIFHKFWDPWALQLKLGLTTWEEDTVSQRSDCHAWGSAPIYEYLVEVAGMRPGGPGWSVVNFQPKLALYNEFSASVPVWLPGSLTKGLAHVSWITTATGSKTVKLALEISDLTSDPLPIYVTLPLQKPRLVWSDTDHVFVVAAYRKIQTNGE
ncbi:rhamnosidase [Fusarium heterosporum]|uniref:Rhamnosidase n=1 Tax=Fusarium heterosporum TaxID=42747 RepID=A0A8H5TTY6_FUSHE|nr:rhamnosidase [Fusarium heterosporum]